MWNMYNPTHNGRSLAASGAPGTTTPVPMVTGDEGQSIEESYFDSSDATKINVVMSMHYHERLWALNASGADAHGAWGFEIKNSPYEGMVLGPRSISWKFTENKYKTWYQTITLSYCGGPHPRIVPSYYDDATQNIGGGGLRLTTVFGLFIRWYRP